MNDWIEHNGGPCPFSEDDWVWVEAKFRDGREFKGLSTILVWENIIAYRVVKP